MTIESKQQQADWNILLHDIRSVQNVASVFRMAECLGVNKIYLSGVTPGPLDRFGFERADFLKISLGTEKRVSWERVEKSLEQNPPSLLYKEEHSSTAQETLVERFIINFKKENGIVIALEQSENSVDYKKVEIDATKKYLIIPGREVEGLDESILKICDVVAEIPQYGEKESLNIFSSMSIACFRFFDL
jgi:23S rRNA (guanosine2251-2'-O)-methyltransferase